MSRALDLLNVGGVALALGLSLVGTQLGSRASTVRAPSQETLSLVTERDDRGRAALRDASGVLVPLDDYQRIASGSLIADRVLSDLCEPTRVVAYSEASRANPRTGQRYAGKALLGSRAPLELVLGLKPDLFVVNHLVDAGYIARLRERGIRVFDLGHMRGLDTLLPNIRALGQLIGAPERAERYAHTLQQRMQRLRARGGQRPRAMYMGAYGDRLFGGALGTSYHDVLEAAGLRDVAGEAGLEGWPELSGEQVLALAPERIVTRNGMGRVICQRQGLSLLPACADGRGVLELDGVLLDDPGPGMLDAAEALREAEEAHENRPIRSP